MLSIRNEYPRPDRYLYNDPNFQVGDLVSRGLKLQLTFQSPNQVREPQALGFFID